MMKLIIYSLIFSLPVWSKVQKFTLSDESFSVDLPPQWEVQKKILGLPLSFLAPMQEDGTRPVLGLVTPEKDAPDAEFVRSSPDKAQEEYKKMKTTWAKEKNAVIADFLAPEEKVINQGKILALGYRYERKGRRYTERNFYIVCNKKFYFAVGLVSAANDSFSEDIDRILGGLKCF